MSFALPVLWLVMMHFWVWWVYVCYWFLSWLHCAKGHAEESNLTADWVAISQCSLARTHTHTHIHTHTPQTLTRGSGNLTLRKRAVDPLDPDQRPHRGRKQEKTKEKKPESEHYIQRATDILEAERDEKQQREAKR